jgi:hypothetical protein
MTLCGRRLRQRVWRRMETKEGVQDVDSENEQGAGDKARVQDVDSESEQGVGDKEGAQGVDSESEQGVETLELDSRKIELKVNGEIEATSGSKDSDNDMDDAQDAQIEHYSDITDMDTSKEVDDSVFDDKVIKSESVVYGVPVDNVEYGMDVVPTEKLFYNVTVNNEVEIRFNPSQNSYRLKNLTDLSYINLSENSMSTLAFQMTPFVKLQDMGLIDTLGQQTAKLHLGSECWFEMYGPFRCCLIKDSANFIHMSYDCMRELHENIFAVGNYRNTIGQISYSLPCAYTHPTLIHFNRCKVCNGEW